MTNLNKVRLPHHRRHLWHPRIGVNAGWRKVKLIAVALVVGLAVYATKPANEQPIIYPPSLLKSDAEKILIHADTMDNIAQDMKMIEPVGIEVRE